MDGGAWQATVHGVTQELDITYNNSKCCSRVSVWITQTLMTTL